MGVGGSGKQSLCRLAAFLSSLEVFQITLRKGYSINDLKVNTPNTKHIKVCHPFLSFFSYNHISESNNIFHCLSYFYYLCLNNLQSDIAALYIKVGVKNIGTVFLHTDAQIPDERFLVLINDMLASGLFTVFFKAPRLSNVTSYIWVFSLVIIFCNVQHSKVL